MNKFYEITKVTTVVSVTRYDIDADGKKDVKFTQDVPYESVMTLDAIIADAKTKVDGDIEVTSLA